jgi:hypothetical protein
MIAYQPFVSAPDVSFWQELAQRKLDVYKLNAEPVQLVGSYASSSGRADVPGRLSVFRDSFSCPRSGLVVFASLVKSSRRSLSASRTPPPRKSTAAHCSWTAGLRAVFAQRPSFWQ